MDHTVLLGFGILLSGIGIVNCAGNISTIPGGRYRLKKVFFGSVR